MIKYTKGPWNKEAIYALLCYASKNRIGVAERWPGDPLNMPNHCDGDQHLIAAAPDMYESLTKIFELANDSNTNPHELLAKISQVAEGAIKKTEGEK